MVNFMMTMMSLMIREQSAINQLESKLTLTIQSIIQKIDQFNSEDIMRFWGFMSMKWPIEVRLNTQDN